MGCGSRARPRPPRASCPRISCCSYATLESVQYQRHDAKSEAWANGDRQPDDVDFGPHRRANASARKHLKKRPSKHAHVLPVNHHIGSPRSSLAEPRSRGLRCGLSYGYKSEKSKFRSNINDRQRKACRRHDEMGSQRRIDRPNKPTDRGMSQLKLRAEGPPYRIAPPSTALRDASAG
jgi:hypothetical protein